jgi:hypothetical protein
MPECFRPQTLGLAAIRERCRESQYTDNGIVMPCE